MAKKKTDKRFEDLRPDQKIQPQEKNNPVDLHPHEVISGAFIRAFRVNGENVRGVFSIKLSSIIAICESYYENDPEGCVIFTYKDSHYYVPLSENEVKKAINSFIFEPDKHWESYGY